MTTATKRQAKWECSAIITNPCRLIVIAIILVRATYWLWALKVHYKYMIMEKSKPTTFTIRY